MNKNTSRVLGVACALGVSACTVSQTEAPALTGPSTFATSVRVTASPDILNLGPSATTPGQSSQIVVNAFDGNGLPKANQAIRLDTFVSGQASTCGQLAPRTVVTGSDGRALAVFTAPTTPPNCASFNSDGTLTVRATPVGSQASAAAASSVNIAMVLPASTTAGGAFTANFSIFSITGSRNFQFDGSSSVSPGHTITSYSWTFSDGHSETGRVVDHDFGSAGTFLVTVNVTDDINQTSFKTALVNAP
jgi:PKD domain-containing protein